MEGDIKTISTPRKICAHGSFGETNGGRRGSLCNVKATDDIKIFPEGLTVDMSSKIFQAVLCPTCTHLFQ